MFSLFGRCAAVHRALAATGGAGRLSSVGSRRIARASIIELRFTLSTRCMNLQRVEGGCKSELRVYAKDESWIDVSSSRLAPERQPLQLDGAVRCRPRHPQTLLC